MENKRLHINILIGLVLITVLLSSCVRFYPAAPSAPAADIEPAISEPATPEPAPETPATPEPKEPEPIAPETPEESAPEESAPEPSAPEPSEPEPAAPEKKDPFAAKNKTQPNDLALSEIEARIIALNWLEDHPFQLGSALEPGKGEMIIGDVAYYAFDLSVVRYAVVEILVSKETGALFHYNSPGNDAFELLDEWYAREHSPGLWAGSAEWITVTSDWTSVDIPAGWTYEIAGDDSHWGIPGEIRAFSEDGVVQIFVGYMIAGNPEDFLAENPWTPFVFDSGTVGYMLDSFLSIMWLNPDLFLGSGVGLQHDGDRSVFENNEEVILRIARSYRSSP